MELNPECSLHCLIRGEVHGRPLGREVRINPEGDGEADLAGNEELSRTEF